MASSISMRSKEQGGWSVQHSCFENAVQGALPYFLPYLEKTSPELAEYYRSDFFRKTGLGFCMESISVEDEKNVLEAFKLAYSDKENEITQLSVESSRHKYLIKFLPIFKELIDMIEKEIYDIERGKLILQEDGTAIVNENFKED